MRSRPAVGGWVSPPPDGCTCRVKPRLKSPPPPPGPACGLLHPCAARGAADGVPHVLPCHPLPHCCVPEPALPAHGGREGRGFAAPGGEVDHPVPDTLDPEQQPLPAAQHALQHPAAPDPACNTLLPLFAEGCGGTWILPSSKPPCSPLQLAVPGRRGYTRCPVCLRRCSERGRDGAKNIHQARAPPSLLPAPTAGSAHGWGGGR